MVLWLCIHNGMGQRKLSALLETDSHLYSAAHSSHSLFVFCGKCFNSYWNSYCEITFGETEKLILMQRD